MRQPKIIERTCEQCGSIFLLASAEARRKGRRRRRFCHKRCSKLGPRNPQWKGDAATVVAGRIRAQHHFPEMPPCQRCGKPSYDRHHGDENTLNNSKDNVEFLCRRCHMEKDGRLERFRQMGLVMHSKARAVQAQRSKTRTHCRNGHEYTPENTKFSEGYRQCRACSQKYQSDYYLRKKALSPRHIEDQTPYCGERKS